MKILNDVGSIFTADTYLHCKDVPKEAKFERSITERIKFKKGKLDEIKRNEQNINNELYKAYFTDHQNSMYKKSSKTENKEISKTRVDLIKKVLTKLKQSLKIHLKMMQLRLKRMKI